MKKKREADDLIIRIATALCAGSCWKQAWRLLGVSQRGCLRQHEIVEKPLATSLLRKKHPLDALARAKTNFERHCLMRLILADDCRVLPPSGMVMISIIKGMADLSSIFGDQMHTTLSALGERTPYTYQLVQRVKAKMEEKRVTSNGEVAKRVFISFNNAGLALNFVEAWLYAQQLTFQQSSSYGEATCLLECGTHDATLRKWVLDVDASIQELKKQPLLWPSAAGEQQDAIKAKLHEHTMAMAVAVSTALFELGFLYRPCHFSVTTRHSAKKMSWHITLNALASHDRWRTAIGAMELKYGQDTLGLMYDFVDKGTKNNSKSQYMQARGSTKVAPGIKADGNYFRDVGLFDGFGRQVEVPASRYSILFYAATSVVVHDPWSLPFVSAVGEAEAEVVKGMLERKRKLSRSSSSGSRKKPTTATTTPAAAGHSSSVKEEEADIIQAQMPLHMTSWDALPETEASWMRGLVERKDGVTKLVTIPSMANPQYWCDTAVQLVNAGRGVVKLYAKVLNPALCPKHLKAMQKVYRHGSNHSMLVVVEESHPSCKGTSYRLFMRCFSDKCRLIKSPHCSGCGWVELCKPDFFMVRAAAACRSAATAKAASSTT